MKGSYNPFGSGSGGAGANSLSYKVAHQPSYQQQNNQFSISANKFGGGSA